ncbi:hypothetical protein B0J17DRAFT_629926 [Rhizoctonia solani]|nr:hypothetical protein B0J17DRAFT_629926 [Rhizoctonia solani]
MYPKVKPHFWLLGRHPPSRDCRRMICLRILFEHEDDRRSSNRVGCELDCPGVGWFTNETISIFTKKSSITYFVWRWPYGTPLLLDKIGDLGVYWYGVRDRVGFEARFEVTRAEKRRTGYRRAGGSGDQFMHPITVVCLDTRARSSLLGDCHIMHEQHSSQIKTKESRSDTVMEHLGERRFRVWALRNIFRITINRQTATLAPRKIEKNGSANQQTMVFGDVPRREETSLVSGEFPSLPSLGHRVMQDAGRSMLLSTIS